MPIQTSISGLNFIFFDDIPEESIKIKDMYDKITFSENQYFYYHDEANDIDHFYSKFQDEIYRPLKIVELKNGCYKGVNRLFHINLLKKTLTK